jgi:hypothetical protein
VDHETTRSVMNAPSSTDKGRSLEGRDLVSVPLGFTDTASTTCLHDARARTIDEMLKLYPDWINRGALWSSVLALKTSV